jgi:cytochrome c peroxidase
MKKLITLGLIVSLVAMIACESKTTEKPTEATETDQQKELAELQQWASQVFKALPENFENKDNKLTPEKIALGKKLYFDKILSKDQTISCNSCHDIAKYGVDQLATSPGNDGENGTRNSPTTFNAAAHIAQFWDGREPHVEAQAGGPVLNPVEMAMASEQDVIDRLMAHAEYPELFKAAFPEAEGITYDLMKTAIGAYERTLSTPSKFDNYINGDLAALNEQEIQGLKDFKEVGCVTCHMGATLGGNMFQKFGIYGDYWEHTQSANIDNGKFEVSQNEADKFIFKVPSLRNIEHTFPYFHDGSVNSLEKSVEIMAKTELNKDLTPEQIENIVVFLKSLTGEIKPEWLPEEPAV